MQISRTKHLLLKSLAKSQFLHKAPSNITRMAQQCFALQSLQPNTSLLFSQQRFFARSTNLQNEREERLAREAELKEIENYSKQYIQESSADRINSLMDEQFRNIDALKEQIRMYFKRQSKGGEGQMTAEENFDDFDRILLQLSMHQMVNPSEVEGIELVEEIQSIFKKRVQRREITSAGYIAYI